MIRNGKAESAPVDERVVTVQIDVSVADMKRMGRRGAIDAAVEAARSSLERLILESEVPPDGDDQAVVHQWWAIQRDLEGVE